VVALCSGLVTIGRVFYEHASIDFGEAVNTRIDAGLRQPIEDIKATRTDVAEIKGKLETLSPLINDLLLERFKKSADLPQGEFQRNLPEIQNLLALARQRGVAVNPVLVRRMSEKLLNIKPRMPDFWPATAQLVNYRSSNGAPPKVLELASVKLPDCTDSEPQPMRITEVLGPHEANVSNALYETCRITLDSATDNERINSLLLGRFPRIAFKNCLVIYRGGQINFKLEWKGEVINMHVEGGPLLSVAMSGNTLQFENCLFEFTLEGVPPPVGQKVTEVLLAQNSNTLKLPHP